MPITRPLSLSAAVLAGSLAASLPAIAQQQSAQPQGQQNQPSQQTQQTQQQTVPDSIVSTEAGMPGVRAGASLVSAVGDLREATGDLITALIEAREGFSASGWNDVELRLEAMQQEIEQMEQALDRRARTTDQEWSTWMSGGDYNLQVTEQVNRLGKYLEEIASALQTLHQSQSGTPIVVGEMLVREVDELREAVSDLVKAREAANTQFARDGQQSFEQQKQRLQAMEEELGAKAMEADKAWATFVASPEFRISIRDNLQTLAEIVNSLFPQGS